MARVIEICKMLTGFRTLCILKADHICMDGNNMVPVIVQLSAHFDADPDP
jgi:hypothetical protein